MARFAASCLTIAVLCLVVGACCRICKSALRGSSSLSALNRAVRCFLSASGYMALLDIQSISLVHSPNPLVEGGIHLGRPKAAFHDTLVFESISSQSSTLHNDIPACPLIFSTRTTSNWSSREKTLAERRAARIWNDSSQVLNSRADDEAMEWQFE